MKKFNHLKFGALCLTALLILDFGINKNLTPRFQYWYEDIAFDLRACIDMIMLGIVIILAVKQWKEKTNGHLYLSLFIIYSVFVGVDFHHGAYFIGDRFIYFILLLIQSIPIVIVLSNYIKNKTGWIKGFIVTGTVLLISGVLYRLFFVGGLPCPVGETRESIEQGFMIHFRDKTRAAWLLAVGLLLFQTGILATIEKKIAKSTNP